MFSQLTSWSDDIVVVTYQSCRKVRSVATSVPFPTSSWEVEGLCFSTHSWPPANAPEPPPKVPLPLLLAPAEAPEDLAPVTMTASKECPGAVWQ